ncbi:50S ribosomal protein L14 [Candidatus Vidania fulgoroideorum]
MIYSGSILYVSDNSGARKVICIKVLGKRPYGRVGDLIKISVRKAVKNSKVKKGLIYNSVILKTKRGILRKNGTKINYLQNSVALLDEKFDFIGTRIFGIITREFKNSFFKKAISLSKYTI